LGQPHLQQGRAQLQSGGGDGVAGRGGAGRGNRPARCDRPRGRADAGDLRATSGAPGGSTMTEAFRPLDRDGMARQVGADLPDGAYVNLGIGIPTLAARYVPADREVVLHSENGIVGMVAAPPDRPPDPGLANASREPIVLVPGASLSDHVISFTM